MSGDVQPRKRKEKRRKKEDSDEIPTNFSSDEQLHVHKDASTGGNICAKILFFLLSFVLLVMIGLVVFEYRGTADDEALVPVSKWAATFEGWLETPVKHDEHADITESGEEEHGDNLGRSDEVTVKQQKIPGVLEKKIKAVSEEEADVPRRKQEKQVSETTQPVEGTSTVTVGQKSHDQHKSEDPGQVKLKAHQSAVKQKVVTEKPVVSKPEKPEGHHDQDLSASKSKHQTRSTEHRAMKNDGFPSGPGGSGQGHKAEDVSASNVMPSKKPKVDAETTKDGPSAATLPKKQKDNTGPALKNEQLPTNPSKPTISGGKNFKDKDSPSDGVHSPPKASRTGDKVETSQKGGKSGTLHSVKEQSSPTKLDGKDKVPVSKSPHVDRSTEEHKKTVERKDKHESKSVPSAPASGAKNSKLDTKDAQMTVEDTVKISDLKTNANDKVQAAGNSASKVKRASNDREKDSVEVEPVMKEAGNLNSKAKEVRDGQSGAKNKLGEKKVEKLQKNEGHSSNERKENKEQITPKLDRHSETVKGVAGKDPSASKVHEDRTRSKVDVEKQKVHSPDSAKVSGDGSSGVPVKVSTDQARKASADNTKSRTPEKSADANAPKKKNVKNNTPVEDTHHSKPRDAKASAIPETTLKHSVRNGDSSKIHEAKPSVQSASSRRNNQDEEVIPMRESEGNAGHQENSVNNKPVNPNVKMSSHSQKASSKQTESEKTTRK